MNRNAYIERDIFNVERAREQHDDDLIDAICDYDCDDVSIAASPVRFPNRGMLSVVTAIRARSVQ